MFALNMDSHLCPRGSWASKGTLDIKDPHLGSLSSTCSELGPQPMGIPAALSSRLACSWAPLGGQLCSSLPGPQRPCGTRNRGSSPTVPSSEI